MSQVISRTKVQHEVLDRVGNKFIGVTFTKKDGSTRKLNGRFKVTKYLKGGTNRVVSNSNSYLSIYDVKSEGYRTINLDTVIEIKALNEVYHVI